MKKYVVATYRPAHPDRGVHVGVYRDYDFPDGAPPTVTAAWLVENARNRKEAIAIVLEAGAGFPVTAYRIIPKL